MIVFYILLFLPLVLQHFEVKGLEIGYEKRNKIALDFFFVFMTILVMLRHESVGSDNRNYINLFHDFSKMNWRQVEKHRLELGFSYYNKIISVFSKNPQVFFAITASAISAMIYPTYKRLCTDTSLTMILFCIVSTFVLMFSGIRQMLAVGLGFIAYEFTRNKKLFPFILIVLLAMSFHTSAFMLAFMYPLYHANITKKWLYVVIPLLAVVFVFNKVIFSALAYVIERYTKYDGSISSTGAYTMLMLFAIFAVFSFLIPEESKLDREIIGLRNFLLLSLVLQMFVPLHTLAMRMNYYYIIFIPLLMPKVIDCRSERWEQIAVVCRHIMVAFFFAYFFLIKARSAGNLNVFPYHFFWENVR